MRIRHLAVHLFLSIVLLAPGVSRAAKSRVRFVSNPPGATVTEATLGEIGVTPFQLDLKRKTVLECTFSKRGYESRTVSRTADALRVEVRADLPALPLTTVRLDVEPRSASVRLSAPDGTEIYSGESGRVHTLPGVFWGDGDTAKFHVEAWAPGYRPADEEVVLTRHRPHDLSIPLAEVTTLLSVVSEPEGAQVASHFLGALGTTPLERRVSMVELLRARSRLNAHGDPTRIVLTFSKRGYRTVARQIPLDFDRDENTLSVALEELGGD